MKIKHIITAQFLMLLAACLQPAAQTKTSTDHRPDETSPAMSAPRLAAQVRVRTLRGRLDDYTQQLRVKSEIVEQARQEAISAGIQGDGAGPWIDTYQQQRKELEQLQTALAPQIDDVRSQIAALTSPDSPAASSPSQSPTPARKRRSASGKKPASPDSTHSASLGR
jgi:hypothetical protein